MFKIQRILVALWRTYTSPLHYTAQNETTIPLNAIKQRLYDSYSQSWYAEINNSNRLITYARYKHEFEFENYLDFITEKQNSFNTI